LTQTTIDVTSEKTLVTLSIMSSEFLMKVAPIVKPRYLKSPYAREVMTWILEYYEAYNAAPQATIQDIFARKRAYVEDEETTTSISTFLGNLSSGYDPENYTNLQYFVDDAERYIKRCGLEVFQEKLAGCLAAGEVEKAEQLVTQYTQVGIPQDTGVSILHDHAAIEEAFTTGAEPLFDLPGDLGLVVNSFYRDDLSAVMGQAKQGKSWAMLYMGEEAMKQGCKVVYVSLEMRKQEALSRAAMSLQWEPKTPQTVIFPKFMPELEPDEVEGPTTKYRIVLDSVEKRGVDLSKLAEMEQRYKMRSDGKGDMRFFFLPAESTSVESLESLLAYLAYYQEYVCDLLIVDYADLHSADGQREYRHGLDHIYKNLRSVAQERHIHILTATQSNYLGEEDEPTYTNVAEDRRKHGHVSKLIPLWATQDDRKKGILRVKSLVDRYQPKTYENCFVLQALSMGRFCIDSRLVSRVALEK